ncbi:unnamed protein product [Schistosoma bovis]|nr:unnamed protein product [Schistosoma bovis]
MISPNKELERAQKNQSVYPSSSRRNWILNGGNINFKLLFITCRYMGETKDQSYFLKDLKPNMKRVSCVFIVLELGPITRTKDGNEVRTAKVADRTGTINISVWNENSSLIAPCDVLQLVQGNTTVRGGCLNLNVGRYGQLMKIGEFCFPFVESPDFSAYNDEWLGKSGDSSSTNKCEPTNKQ